MSGSTASSSPPPASTGAAKSSPKEEGFPANTGTDAASATAGVTSTGPSCNGTTSGSAAPPLSAAPSAPSPAPPSASSTPAAASSAPPPPSAQSPPQPPPPPSVGFGAALGQDLDGLLEPCMRLGKNGSVVFGYTNKNGSGSGASASSAGAAPGGETEITISLGDDDPKALERLRREFLFSFGRLNQYARTLRTTGTGNGPASTASSGFPASGTASGAAGAASAGPTPSSASLPHPTAMAANSTSAAGANPKAAIALDALLYDDEAFHAFMQQQILPAKKRRTDPTAAAAGGGGGTESSSSVVEVVSESDGPDAAAATGSTGRSAYSAGGGQSTTTNANTTNTARPSSAGGSGSTGDAGATAAAAPTYEFSGDSEHSLGMMQSILGLLQQSSEEARLRRAAASRTPPEPGSLDGCAGVGGLPPPLQGECSSGSTNGTDANSHNSGNANSTTATAAGGSNSAAVAGAQLECVRALLAAARRRAPGGGISVSAAAAASLLSSMANLSGAPGDITGGGKSAATAASLFGTPSGSAGAAGGGGGASGPAGSLPAELAANVASFLSEWNLHVTPTAAAGGGGGGGGTPSSTAGSGSAGGTREKTPRAASRTPPPPPSSGSGSAENNTASSVAASAGGGAPGPGSTQATGGGMSSDGGRLAEAMRAALSEVHEKVRYEDGNEELATLRVNMEDFRHRAARLSSLGSSTLQSIAGCAIRVSGSGDPLLELLPMRSDEAGGSTATSAANNNNSNAGGSAGAVVKGGSGSGSDPVLDLLPLQVDDPNCAVMAHRFGEFGAVAASMLWCYLENKQSGSGETRMLNRSPDELQLYLNRLLHRLHQELHTLPEDRLQQIIRCLGTSAQSLTDADEVFSAISTVGAILLLVTVPLPLLQRMCEEFGISTSDEATMDPHLLPETLAEKLGAYMYPLRDGARITVAHLPFLPRLQVHEHAPGSYTCTIDNASNMGRVVPERLTSNRFSCNKVKWRAVLMCDGQNMSFLVWHRHSSPLSVHVLMRTSEPKKKKPAKPPNAAEKTAEETRAASALFLESETLAEPGQLFGLTDFLNLRVAIGSPTTSQHGLRTYSKADDRIVFQLSLNLANADGTSLDGTGMVQNRSIASAVSTPLQPGNRSGKPTPQQQQQQQGSGAGGRSGSAAVRSQSSGSSSGGSSRKKGDATPQSQPTPAAADAGEDDNATNTTESFEAEQTHLLSEEANTRQEIDEGWSTGYRQLQNEEVRAAQRAQQRAQDRERKELLAAVGPTPELVRNLEKFTQTVQATRQQVSKLQKDKEKEEEEMVTLQQQLTEGQEELTQLQEAVDVNNALLDKLEEDIKRAQNRIAEKRKRIARREQKMHQTKWSDLKRVLEPTTTSHDTLAIDDFGSFLSSPPPPIAPFSTSSAAATPNPASAGGLPLQLQQQQQPIAASTLTRSPQPAGGEMAFLPERKASTMSSSTSTVQGGTSSMARAPSESGTNTSVVGPPAATATAAGVIGGFSSAFSTRQPGSSLSGAGGAGVGSSGLYDSTPVFSTQPKAPPTFTTTPPSVRHNSPYPANNGTGSTTSLSTPEPAGASGDLSGLTFHVSGGSVSSPPAPAMSALGGMGSGNALGTQPLGGPTSGLGGLAFNTMGPSPFSTNPVSHGPSIFTTSHLDINAQPFNPILSGGPGATTAAGPGATSMAVGGAPTPPVGSSLGGGVAGSPPSPAAGTPLALQQPLHAPPPLSQQHQQQQFAFTVTAGANAPSSGIYGVAGNGVGSSGAVGYAPDGPYAPGPVSPMQSPSPLMAPGGGLFGTDPHRSVAEQLGFGSSPRTWGQ